MAGLFFVLAGSGVGALAVLDVDCVSRDSDEVGRSAGDAAGDDEADVGVAPHLPKNHPPELLPVAGPSLLRGSRFWLAIVEYRKERLSLLSALPCERLPCAVAVHGVSSGSTEPAPLGVEKRDRLGIRSCAGRDCKVCMSIPEIEMSDS